VLNGSLFSQNLSDADFSSIRKEVYRYCGIKISPRKKQMVEGRLRSRIRSLGLESFTRYCQLVFAENAGKEEFLHLVDAITTNKTEFFREPAHFTYLSTTLLPSLLQAKNRSSSRPLQVWSSACSTGQEPYTLAIELAEFRRLNPSFSFQIMGTDICTQVLEVARRAVYSDEVATAIPPDLRKRYLLRSKKRNGQIRIAPEIRQLVRFRRLNLNEREYGIKGKIDIIFCRNVIIYFDAQTQEAILQRLIRCLRTGGFLFMGHSETIHGMALPLRPLAPTIYQKI